MIEHQLHDINNKLNVCMYIVTCLSKKYDDNDFIKLQSNLDRAAELVTISFDKLQSRHYISTELVNINLLESYLHNIFEDVNSSFKFDLNYQLKLSSLPTEKFIMLEKKLLSQIIDNLFDNSRKALASKIIIRMLIKEEKHLILEIVDNGIGEYKSTNQYNNLPHGIGTELIKYNVEKMNAKVYWSNRLDSTGKIIRIYFNIVD